MGFLLERARDARVEWRSGAAMRVASSPPIGSRRQRKSAGGWVGGYSGRPGFVPRTHAAWVLSHKYHRGSGAPVERARRDWTTHALFPNAENTRVSMSAVASSLNARVVARHPRASRPNCIAFRANVGSHAVPARSVQSSSARAPPRAARAALESNPGESFDAGAYGEPVTFKFHDDGVSADVVHARTGRLLRVQSAKDWTSRVSASVAQRAFRSQDLAQDVVPFVAERESPLPVVYYSFMHDGSSVEYDASHRQVRRRGVDGKTFVNNVVESAQVSKRRSPRRNTPTPEPLPPPPPMPRLPSPRSPRPRASRTRRATMIRTNHRIPSPGVNPLMAAVNTIEIARIRGLSISP